MHKNKWTKLNAIPNKYKITSNPISINDKDQNILIFPAPFESLSSLKYNTRTDTWNQDIAYPKHDVKKIIIKSFLSKFRTKTAWDGHKTIWLLFALLDTAQRQ